MATLSKAESASRFHEGCVPFTKIFGGFQSHAPLRRPSRHRRARRSPDKPVDIIAICRTRIGDILLKPARILIGLVICLWLLTPLATRSSTAGEEQAGQRKG